MSKEDRQIDFFINKVLIKYIKRVTEEVNRNSGNTGIAWRNFRKEYFDTIYRRDDKQCKYCTIYLSSQDATLDHILSPMRGGLNELSNMALACSWCNKDKGILTADEYRYKQLDNTCKGIYPPGYNKNTP